METENNTAKRNLKPNPFDEAGTFSKIFFLWLAPLFRTGHKRELDEADLTRCPDYDRSERLTSQLERSWAEELQNCSKSNRKPSLLKCFVKIHAVHYLLLCAAILFEETGRTVNPVLIGYMLMYFRPASPLFVTKFVTATVNTTNQTLNSTQDAKEISLKEASLYIMGIIIISLLITIVHHYYFFGVQRVGMEIRVACIGIMYRKVLRLSSNALSKTSSGQIVNLMSNDVARFDMNLFTCYLIVGPLHVLATVIVLYHFIGWSCLISTATLAVFTPVQILSSPFFSKIRTATAQKTDKRVQLMDEIIKAMKIIKMYCWEKPFSHIIHQRRREELAEQWKLKKGWLVIAIPYYISRHIYVFVVAVSTIYISDAPFTSSYLFMVISLSNAMIVSMTLFFGMAFINGAQCLASFRRIQEFLELREKTVKSLEYKNGTSIEMSNSEDRVKETMIPLLHTNGNVPHNTQPDITTTGIHVNHLSALWPGQETSNQLTNINFTVKPGELLAVVGPVGAGKSSLLMSILGECPHVSGSVQVNGSIGYSSQEAWIFSSTLRQNVTFGREYNTQRFNHVIKITSLDKDILEMPFSDQSLVGERGVSLSGGQKARVNLSRAIYKSSDIYLLDDPLSAVDTTVARHLFDKCIRGELKGSVVILVTHQLQFIQKADKILVLKQGEQLALGTYSELCNSGIDFTELLKREDDKPEIEVYDKQEVGRVILEVENEEGDLSKHKSLHDLTTDSSDADNLLSVEFRQRAHTSDLAHRLKPKVRRLHSNTSTHSAAGLSLADVSLSPSISSLSPAVHSETFKQDDAEEKAAEETRITGRVSLKLYLDLLRNGANYLLIAVVVFLFLGCQVAFIMTDWWLTQWAALNEEYVHRRSVILRNNLSNTATLDQLNLDLKSDNQFYLIIQLILITSVAVLATLRILVFQRVFVRASQKLHNKIFAAVLRAPMVFFDSNPVGRILNRFSKDLGLVDENVPILFNDVCAAGLMTGGALLTSVVVNPWLLVLIIPVLVLMFFLRRFYIQTSRQVKRLEGTTNSPIYSHLSSTISGLYSIRAYESQPIFCEQFSQHQNTHTASWFLFLATNRWLGIRLDLLCCLLITVVGYGLIITKQFLKIDSSQAGLSMTYTLMLLAMFQYFVRITAELENIMTSYERVKEYGSLPSEAATESSPQFKPPDHWPQHGRIQINNASLKYSEDSPTILKNIFADIRAGEKVGIVGRTGAGKSSLLTMLFRICEPDGEIIIDDINISQIGLHDLRKVISIIPQDPVLFTGSVRYNLDPFDQYTDEKIWFSLQQVHLADHVRSLSDALLSKVDSGGSNFSVGQRQLLCLARSILSSNKILVVDEATANVDTRTDALIQTTLHEQFKECTVLTIAHRLNTIMDSDRILVLHQGQVVEFDTPDNLQKDKSGHFSTLVEQMNLAEKKSSHKKKTV